MARTTSVTIRQNASIAGFSLSLDGGILWTAGTKIYPNIVPVYGDPIAVFWSDPSTMAGYVRKRLVAYASLAISQSAFDSAKGMDGALHFWPGGGFGGIIDSVCISLSSNGGQTFGSLFCKRPLGIGAAGTDQPTVGIGKADRIFVAVDDFLQDKIDLYELTFFGFVQLAVDVQMETASHTPRIARDQDGELWLAASKRGSSKDVRMCHIRPGTSFGDPGACDFVGQVTQIAEPFPILAGSSIGPIRTGLTVSFAANRIQALIPATDFYFAYHTKTANTLHIGATQCRLTAVSTLSCFDVPQWSSGIAGFGPQQFQPTIEVIDRSESGNGTEPDPQYVFYESDGNGVAPQHARVRRALLHGSPFTVPPSITLQDLPLADDSRVCTAKYQGGIEYWGDFFGFKFVPAQQRHVTVYSSDENLGCSQTNNFQGHHLHLQSWFWPN